MDRDLNRHSRSDDVVRGARSAYHPGMTNTKTAALFSVSLFALGLQAGCGAELESAEPVNPSVFEPTAMPACGTALAAWNGTTAYSNGNNTGTGISCAGVGSYGYQYQCVELVMRHFIKSWGLRWYGNAKDLLVNAPRDKVDVYGNGDSAHPPKPGDMLVWTNGTYGHVALITRVGGGTLDIIEQNVSGNGRATLAYNGASVGSRWGSWVPAGWAHAKANGGGGGVSWDCSKSAYNGGQYWTCSGGSLYKCLSGVPQQRVCPAGCNVMPLGTDDTCK